MSQQFFSINLALFSPLNLLKFSKNSSLGPPNSDQLSIQIHSILLLHIEEHTDEPFQVPISKYLALYIEQILL